MYSAAKNIPFSNSELDPYFFKFEQEASARGLTIDLKELGVSGHIVAITDEHIAGKCKHSDTNPAMVMVDQEFWSSAHDLHKEYVIFHELGHCVLGRTHLNETLETGACKSIMASDNRVCGFDYSVENRKYYLDELFQVK